MCSYSVESVVDDMLEVLAHANLPHQLVLVAIHPCQLADVGKGVLQTISQLECIYVTKAILDVGVNYQFGESKNFTTQVEGVAKTRLLPLLQRHNSLLQHTHTYTHACTHAHVPVRATILKCKQSRSTMSSDRQEKTPWSSQKDQTQDTTCRQGKLRVRTSCHHNCVTTPPLPNLSLPPPHPFSASCLSRPILHFLPCPPLFLPPSRPILPNLGGQCLHWFEVEVVVKVKVVEVFAMNEKVEHIVALTTDLKPHLHPVQLG